MRKKCGVALLAVSGILALLAFLAAAFLRTGALLTQQGESVRDRRSADLAAESGLEYAAARLWEDPSTPWDRGVARTAVNRRDDWTCRPGSANPSYARGDGFKDVNGDGTFNTGDIPIPRPPMDLDGNGRFDAWSGRLRGGRSPFDGRFSLKIESAGGFICINSGEIGSPLDDHDLDGVLNSDDPGYPVDVPANAYCDPAYPGNVHLVNLLDNLGAILDLTCKIPSAPYCPGAPALGVIETSTLGSLVVAHRPPGGYGGLEPLRAVLGPGDFEAVAPHLTTAGRSLPVSCLAGDPKDGFYDTLIHAPLENPRYEFHVPIDFNHAPEEVLRASLRHITASGTYERALFGPVDAHTHFVRLYPEGEADALARSLAVARPVHTWKGFLGALHAAGASAFRDDPFTNVNEQSQNWMLLKEDLVMAQTAPDGYFADSFSWRNNSLEVPREQSLKGTDGTSVRRIFKESMFGLLTSFPFDMTGQLKTVMSTSNAWMYIPSYATTEYDLAALPSAFRIAVDGQANGQSGIVSRSAAELGIESGEIRLDGQQDFEMHATSARPITPALPWRQRGGLSRTEETHIGDDLDTTPRFPLDAYSEASILPVPPANPAWEPQNLRYPPVEGGLQLRARQTEEIDLPCVFAMPMNRDPLAVPANRWYTSNSGTPSDWLDNLGDPAGVPGSPRSPDPVQSTSFLPVPASSFLRGWQTGPMGIQGNSSDYSTSQISFDWPPGTFCLPVNPNSQIANSTFSFWYPARGGETAMVLSTVNHKTPRVSLQYKAINSNSWTSKLRWHFLGGSTEKFRVSTTGGLVGTTRDVVPWWTTDPVASLAGWHHVALDIAPSGDSLLVYVDGKPDPQGPLAVLPSPPIGLAVWRLEVNFPLDDLRLFTPSLGAAAIERQALQEDRYERSGMYSSVSYRLDPDRLPRGARIRRVAWNGFIPQQTRGAISCELYLYRNGNDVELAPGATWPDEAFRWDGTGIPTALFNTAACDEIEILVEIFAQFPSLAITDSGGTVRTPLRDTPSLDSISIGFADRPRWTGLSAR